MSLPPRVVWAYTYRLTPPQPVERLRKVKAMLAKEHREAAARDGRWEGRMVVDDRVANILVLSDSPDLDRDVNRRLEAELRAIDSGFAVTLPFEFQGDGQHPYAGPADEEVAPDDSVVGGPATAEPSVPPRADARTPRVPRKK